MNKQIIISHNLYYKRESMCLIEQHVLPKLGHHQALTQL